jgi:hypothetical protein
VVVPLRVRSGFPGGQARVRIRVAFQACDSGGCRAPDSVLLEAPVDVPMWIR